MKGVFTETNGRFSWRKMLTAICGMIFLAASMGYLVFGWKELPVSYTSVISGVFVFYFTRRFYDNAGMKNAKPKDD